ncbi:MAG: DUF5717 family protein [Lachnospiraceae bacterium]|nr:DUF5717 family protein [Lachnospiraceae bacterium]
MYKVEGLLSAETTEYVEDVLECTPGELELSVLAGKKAEGSLFLHSQSGRKLNMFLYSNHYRMQPQVSFAKGEEINLTFRFDASGLAGGQQVSGKLVLLSDAGQLLVPFHVTVTDHYEDEQLGSIRNLFHFTNLASKDWHAAIRFFYSDKMERLLKGHDARFIPLYRSLSCIRDNDRNMDEFLIGMNKKKRATFTLDEDTLLLPQVYEPQQQILTIRRKGWGYSNLKVTVDGKYLTTEKTLLTESDFTDNICKLAVFLLPTDGYEHRERIIIDADSPSGRMVCELMRLGKGKRENPKEKELKEKKRQTALLMRAYLDYSTGMGDGPEALARAEKCIEKINHSDGRNITGRLYQTHLLCVMGRVQEANWIFDHVRRVIEKEAVTPAQQAYYWYLEAILSVEDQEQASVYRGSVVRKLRDLFANNRQDAVITCLYLRMLPQGQITPVKEMSLYEECYYGGCESPILLREAYRIIADNPAYLSGLGRFEIAILRFALHYQLLTPQLEERLIELTKREKEAPRVLMSFLSQIYRDYQEDDLLEAVCGLLIRTGKRDKESFFWYKTAVDKQLRITMLYESYMAARDPEDLSLPPKYVLMYFAYRCQLENRTRAHLYRIILENHTRLGALIDDYDPRIREFARQQLAQGECNSDLAVCYRFLFKDPEEIKRGRESLPAVGFLYEVKMPKGKAQKIIVAQNGLEKETEYPVSEEGTLIKLYTEDYFLLLDDGAGNRVLADETVVVRRLLPLELIRSELLESKDSSAGLSLLRMNGRPDDFCRRTEDWPLYMEAASDTAISLPLRLSVLERLLRVLYEREETETLKSLLLEYPIEGADEKKRGQIIAYHIWLEQDEMALSLLWEYGFEGVPPKSLNRLIRRGIESAKEGDPKWLALMYYTYRQGKFTLELLEYLCKYYEGGISQMYQIFKDAGSFEVDALPIAERILIATAYTHGYLPQWDTVFGYYMKKGGKKELIKRFLQDLSFRYFVGGEVVTDQELDFLYKALLREEDMPRLCEAAWLYAMSDEQTEPDEKQITLIKELVNDYLCKYGYLPFFEAFLKYMPSLLPYAAKTWLVYRSKPGRRVKLSYLGHADDDDSYRVHYLDELCPGYYAKGFELFYGESLHYYIQEEDGGELVLTHSGQIERSEALEREYNGRFEMLYGMTMSADLGDTRTAALFAEEYIRADRLTEILFG